MYSDTVGENFSYSCKGTEMSAIAHSELREHESLPGPYRIRGVTHPGSGLGSAIRCSFASLQRFSCRLQTNLGRNFAAVMDDDVPHATMAGTRP
jgi:hypothetical protein